jgi:hypothetical protein
VIVGTLPIRVHCALPPATWCACAAAGTAATMAVASTPLAIPFFVRMSILVRSISPLVATSVLFPASDGGLHDPQRVAGRIHCT